MATNPSRLQAIQARLDAGQHIADAEIRWLLAQVAVVQEERDEQRALAAQTLIHVGEMTQRVARLICPHGDPLCPCKDGDACHYEGTNPMSRPDATRLGELAEEANTRVAQVHQRVAKLLNLLDTYGEHNYDCIRSCWGGGEPTPEGGYRHKYQGIWYESRPVDRTPACDCGFTAALDSVRETP